MIDAVSETRIKQQSEQTNRQNLKFRGPTIEPHNAPHGAKMKSKMKTSIKGLQGAWDAVSIEFTPAGSNGTLIFVQ